ncbi:MAG TPA: phosphatidylserine/phosphatidylglycerophosphate/cardiolipin synthase family protein [Sphingomicrobium sp.]|nr:phosphatidylserine/phosphatidylglycerophosphate/cardiolipin synthase family protein [Sphingomicrobium sp.]
MESQPPASPTEPIRATVEGNRIELIETGAERLRLLLGLIGGAERSLKIMMYMFSQDEVGKAVLEALTAAALRKIDVQVIIDGFGSDAPLKFFAELEEAGGRTCVFNGRYGRNYLLRNHQKLIVVDDEVVILGGANIQESYMGGPGHRQWRDLWLSVQGPQAAVAGDYLDSLFRWSTRPKASLRSLRRMVARHSSGRGALQWKFSGPLSMRNSWWRSIGRDIGQASRLDMIFAYFAPPGAMVRRIGQVGLRGRARIITPSRSDNNATVAAARHSYSRLIRRHVEVYEYQPARLHSKLVIVDDVVHIGSSNFDYRSFYLNLEVMLRIEDPAFADSMRGYFERERRESSWITPALHQKRANPWRRLKWAAAHFLVNVVDYTVTRRLNFRA